MIAITRKETASHNFSVEIIDGCHGLHSTVAEVKAGTIHKSHGTGKEYAKVICDAIDKYLAKRANLKGISTKKAQEAYANGEDIYFFSDEGELMQVGNKTEFYDSPKRKYHI